MDMVDPLGRRARIRLHVNRMSRRRIAHAPHLHKKLCAHAAAYSPRQVVRDMATGRVMPRSGSLNKRCVVVMILMQLCLPSAQDCTLVAVFASQSMIAHRVSSLQECLRTREFQRSVRKKTKQLQLERELCLLYREVSRSFVSSFIVFVSFRHPCLPPPTYFPSCLCRGRVSPLYSSDRGAPRSNVTLAIP